MILGYPPISVAINRCLLSCRSFSELYKRFSAAMRLTHNCGTFQRFTDVALDSLMERLRDELRLRHASPLFVQGIAQAIAIHLARNYAISVEELHSGSPSLPGYKLRQITDWMAEPVAEDLNLARLAAQVGLSKNAARRHSD